MGYDIPEDHHGPTPADVKAAADKDQQAKTDALQAKLAAARKAVEDKSGALTTKDTNPKDSVGVKKWRQYTCIPITVLWELGIAMLEGARKYGRHNYRVAGVRASVYVDAAKGHIDTWWEGEDDDAESGGISHLTKAIASLTVLRDAMVQQKFVDDRPPSTNLAEVKARLQKCVDALFERIPNALPAYTEASHPSGHKGGSE